MNKKVRVRFAPSPTGPLHIGGVRTALYNYLFARKHGGDFLLRIEDTDSSRFVAGAEDYIIESLEWLGIEIDEGIGAKTEGTHAPYRQSERKDIYKKYVQQLLDEGKAYLAFDTPLALESKRAEIPNFQYDASTRMSMQNSLTLSQEDVKKRIAEGENYVVRIKIEPGEEIHLKDLIRDEVTINSSILDDKVIYKSADELPTYHLANVVDDHLMEITHVIRGEEWLPSAPLHVLLYRYFGWGDSMPEFAHLPLLLKPDGNGKLSKRDGDRLGFPVFPLDWEDHTKGSLSSGYREAGYFPEAVVNFLALLGWNPGTDQEFFTMEELIDSFSLDRVSRSGAKFDYEKGKWFNHQYLQKKSNDELADIYQHILIEKDIIEDFDRVKRVVELVKERAYFISDLWDLSHYFFQAPDEYDAKSVKKRWKQDSKQHLEGVMEVMEHLDDFSSEEQEKEVIGWIKEQGYSLGVVLNALRLAIVGASAGPHLFDITAFIGKEETLKRIDYAINRLGGDDEEE